MAALTGLIIASIIGSVLAATTSGIATAVNYSSVNQTNKANAQMQADANATNLEAAQLNNQTQLDLAKNGISYRMQDLQNAGLNPVLAAGQVSQPTATLSMPNAQASRNQAPLIDMNGISSAITAMNNTLLTQHLIDQRSDIASNYQRVSRENNEARNSVLRDLYKRKGAYLSQASDLGNPHVHSAKQVKNATKYEKDWDKIMKELSSMPYKY